MHDQNIIDSLLSKLNFGNSKVKVISLQVNEEILKERLIKDIQMGLRTEDMLPKSLARLDNYKKLNTIKVDTNNKTINQISEEIIRK